MSVRDLLKAWDEATQRALQERPENEILPEQFNSTAGLRVRSGLLAGGWAASDDCTTQVCPTDGCNSTSGDGVMC